MESRPAVCTILVSFFKPKKIIFELFSSYGHYENYFLKTIFNYENYKRVIVFIVENSFLKIVFIVAITRK